MLLIVAALIQATLSPYIKIGGVHPDLVLLLVISWTVLRGLEEGVLWALIGGVSLDLLSGAPFGVFSISMLLVALVVSFFHGRTLGSSIVIPAILTFPLSFVFNGLALLLLYILGRPVAGIDVFSVILLPAAVYNTALILVVYPGLYLLNRWLNPQPLSI